MIIGQLEKKLGLKRKALDIVHNTINHLLHYQIDFPTGKVHYMKPDEIYINERNQTTGGVEETRYPTLSIVPVKEDTKYTKHTGKKYLTPSPTAGIYEVWRSNMYVDQENYFCLETTTKCDLRYWAEMIKQWFEVNRKGNVLIGDILPEGVTETVRMLLHTKGIEYDLDEAPFKVYFPVTLTYRLYHQTYDYRLDEIDLRISGGIEGQESELFYASGIT